MVALATDVPHPFEGAEGVLASVGDTPLIALDRSIRGLVPDGVSVLVKAEWFNPGGSVKDRPALSMVLDAERRGLIQPGHTLLDASSGNTGIALAMIAAVRGYTLVLCLPKNANEERKRILKAYGAQIVTTSPLEGSDGAIREARRLAEAHPEWHYINQYDNPANWQAHFGTTGPEIVRQTGRGVTHFVATVGTGGTFTGTSRYLKAALPNIEVVEVQPDSPFHGLEGLKHMETAIVPGIYDATLADRRMGAPTEESFAWVRRIAKHEGLLIGPSGGAAIWAAVEVAKTLTSGVVVTILADSGTRYLSESHIWETP